jgi:nucleotide-binding universal stress UspA family protein
MKVLIATDGSECSKRAAEKACELVTGRKETSVRVLSVYEDTYPLAVEPYAVSSAFYQQIIDAACQQSEKIAADATDDVRQLISAADVDLTTTVLRGSPEQQIIEEARRWNADIIVVGSHGRGFWGRMLGSVSDAVVHHAPCSVLVVREAKN